ncbi:MAG: beta-propeller domain-containing protein [Deferrisomatales bacterium]
MRPANPRRAVTAALVACLLTACSQGSSEAPAPSTLPPAALRAAPFADCEALRAYLVETAAAQAELASAYPGVTGIAAVSEAMGAPSAAAAGNGVGEGAAGARDFSTTNIQESGVDEPDFVKTDGDYLYVVTGGRFLVFDAWPAAAAAELARVEIEGDPLALLVHGARVLVLSQLWQPEAPVPGFAGWSGARLKATVLDVGDRTAPALLRESYFEGSYLDARMVDGRAHLVYTSWIPALGGGAPGPGGVPAPAAAARRNLQETALAELLPQYRDTIFGAGEPATRSGAVCPCENTFQPPVPNGTGFVTVVTLDLGVPAADLQAVSLLSNGGVVYGSRTSLYLATPNDDYWLWWPVQVRAAAEPQATTRVHKFDLTGSPAYLASGTVNGWVLNQFSMSEHEGVFRIATTDDRQGSGRSPENTVFLLRQEGEALVQAGSLPGLGEPGERLYAVRFLGDRGFAVTFRQTDPLYALDLSDPAAPRVAGEFHVPGFSTYLHPVGLGHLLAVGQDTAPGAWGVKLSLYDVSNLAQPREVATESVGLGSSSEAQYEHKAFTYFPALGALALPITRWTALPTVGGTAVTGVFAGLQVYDVNPAAPDPAAVFALRGRIDHSEFYRDEGAGYWHYPEAVRRAFFIGEDGPGYFLYSVSSRGLKVTPFADLAIDLVALPLPAPERYWYHVGVGSPVE